MTEQDPVGISWIPVSTTSEEKARIDVPAGFAPGKHLREYFATAFRDRSVQSASWLVVQENGEPKVEIQYKGVESALDRVAVALLAQAAIDSDTTQSQ